MKNVKAIILAGGMGTRLRPITYTTPKPLCRVLGESVIERILRLLGEAGIRETVISTMYMSEAFTGLSCENVNIKISKEEEPLGSAGGVKYSLKYLQTDEDDDILILSGDGVFDFNLNEILSYHRTKNSDITIVTYPCDDPSEYGVILSDEEGKIFSFCEKPAWHEIRSNIINTGIYIVKRKIFDLVPEKRAFDFSKDLFPYAMGLNKKLYAYEASGYWCDIGDIKSFYDCNIDALNHNIDISTFADSAVKSVSHADAGKVTVNNYFSQSSKISSSANIGKNNIIEDRVVVENNAKVNGSILMQGAYVSKGAIINNSIICENAYIGENCEIMSGCVVGANTVIRKGAIIGKGIKIWPGKIIESGNYVTRDVYFDSEKNELYTDDGFNAGQFNESINTGYITRIGCAIAYALKEDVLSGSIHAVPRVGILHNGESGCALIAETLLCAIKSSGVRCYSFLKGFEAQALYLSSNFMTDFIIFITDDGTTRIIKMFKNSQRLTRKFERKTEAYIKSPKSEPHTDVFDVCYIDSLKYMYYSYLIKNCHIKNITDQKVYIYSSKQIGSPGEILCNVLKEKNVNVVDTPENDCICISISNDGLEASIEQRSDNKSPIFFDTFHIKSALIIYGSLRRMSQQEDESLRENNRFMQKTDMIEAVSEFLRIIFDENMSLTELMASLPTFDIYVKEMTTEEIGKENRAFVMRKLYENHKSNTNMSNAEGINLIFDTGSVTVVPKRSGGFKIISEAMNMESAREISYTVEQEILNY